MNKFKDHPKQGHKYFRMAKNIQEKNPSLEVLLFPYMYGQPQVFMRGKCIYFESQDWVAVQGGMGSAHGYHETWSWKIPREDVDPVEFRLFTLTTTDEREALNSAGGLIGIMQINEISTYLMNCDNYELSDDESYVPIKSKTVLMHMYSGNHCGTVAITRDDANGDERAFIKPRGSSSFEEVNIVEYRRYRDGGTCIIITDRFVLYVPTPFKKDTAAVCCLRNWTCTDSDWIEFASQPTFSDYENPDNPNVVRDIEYTPEGMHFAEQNGFVIDVMGVNADKFVKKIEDIVKRFNDTTYSRFPYTYHHDLIRMAHGADISRSDIAALKNWSILELYASALTQLSNECGSKITEFLFNGEDLSVLRHARKIAAKHVDDTKLLLKLA